MLLLKAQVIVIAEDRLWRASVRYFQSLVPQALLELSKCPFGPIPSELLIRFSVFWDDAGITT